VGGLIDWLTIVALHSGCANASTRRTPDRSARAPIRRAHGTLTCVADITVRFWAGAQRAAGRAEEPLSAATVGELRELLAGRDELTKVCAVASFLVDGQQASDTTPLAAGSVVDVLPPFAGG
jgi:molybdopterin converting factor small subunit